MVEETWIVVKTIVQDGVIPNLWCCITKRTIPSTTTSSVGSTSSYELCRVVVVACFHIALGAKEHIEES